MSGGTPFSTGGNPPPPVSPPPPVVTPPTPAAPSIPTLQDVQTAAAVATAAANAALQSQLAAQGFAAQAQQVASAVDLTSVSPGGIYSAGFAVADASPGAVSWRKNLIGAFNRALAQWEFILGPISVTNLIGRMTTPIISTVLTTTSLSQLYVAGLTVAKAIVVGIRRDATVDIDPGYGALGKFGTKLIAVPYTPTPLAAGTEPVLQTRNGIIRNGESTDIGENALPLDPVTQVAPLVNHQTFDISVKMTAPSLAPVGILPDNGLEKGLVEDALASEVGNTQGTVGLWQTVTTASRYAAARGVTPYRLYASACGKGGATMAVLFGPGSTWQPNLDYHMLAQARNAASAGESYRLQLLHHIHCANNQKLGTTQDGYILGANGFRAYVAYVNTQAGHPVHCLSTISAYNALTDFGPSQGIIAEAITNPLVHLCCPDYFLQRGYDFQHYTAPDEDLLGAYFGRATDQFFALKVPDCVTIRGAYRRGSIIRAFYNTPRALQINQNGYTTQDAGYAVINGDSTIRPLLALPRATGCYVDIPLATAPTRGTPLTLNLALNYCGRGLRLFNGGSGDVCDTTEDEVTINGVVRKMPHFAFPHSIPVMELD